MENDYDRKSTMTTFECECHSEWLSIEKEQYGNDDPLYQVSIVCQVGLDGKEKDTIFNRIKHAYELIRYGKYSLYWLELNKKRLMEIRDYCNKELSNG